MIVHIFSLFNKLFRATVFDNCTPRLDLYSCVFFFKPSRFYKTVHEMVHQ